MGSHLKLWRNQENLLALQLQCRAPDTLTLCADFADLQFFSDFNHFRTLVAFTMHPSKLENFGFCTLVDGIGLSRTCDPSHWVPA